MTDSLSSQQGCDPNCDQMVNNIQDMLQTAPYLPPCSDCCIHKIKDKGYSTDSISSPQAGCDEVVINIIEKMLRTAPSLLSSSEYCIHKVPVNLRNANEAAYTPQIISIGPLHREDKKLKPMQAYKICFLNNLLRRKPSIKLEDYVKTLRGLEKQVRDSYFDQELISKISSDDFVKMMLLDGCFIVEFFTSLEDDHQMLCDPYWAILRLDLTLFENQLPYFLLEKLFDFIKCNNPTCQSVSFFDLSVHYFSYFLNVKDIGRLKNSGYQVKHFLDLILNCQRSSVLKDSVQDNTVRRPIYLPSATELHESGVEFKKGESDCFLDIKFNKNGVLEIPALKVEDHTEHMFRNMIAMEECSVRTTDACITHYIILLDFFISTPKDVVLLRRKQIINNYLGSDEEVAALINKLGITGVVANTTDSPYYEHLNNMDDFYNKRRHRWKANLKRNYFHNPWTILSLIAAIVLLFCTIAQTVFSFISLYQ